MQKGSYMSGIDREQALKDLKSFSTFQAQEAQSILDLVKPSEEDTLESLEIGHIVVRQALVTLYQSTCLRVKYLCIAALQLEKKAIEALDTNKAVFALLEKRGVNLTSLESYGAFDEVRLIANSVSHSSYIRRRDPLHTVYGWHVGQLPAHRIVKDFSRLTLACTELCEELQKGMVKGLE